VVNKDYELEKIKVDMEEIFKLTVEDNTEEITFDKVLQATQKAYKGCPSLISNCITHGQFVIGSNKLDNLSSHFMKELKL